MDYTSLSSFSKTETPNSWWNLTISHNMIQISRSASTKTTFHCRQFLFKKTVDVMLPPKILKPNCEFDSQQCTNISKDISLQVENQVIGRLIHVSQQQSVCNECPKNRAMKYITLYILIFVHYLII